MEPNLKIPRTIKIGLFGDSQVGKSSICNTFAGVEFDIDIICTIDFDKFEKKVRIKNGEDIKLVFYDTAGGKRFRAQCFKALRNVQGIILVFELTKRETFDHLDEWLKTLKEKFINPFIIIFGNKADLDKEEYK